MKSPFKFLDAYDRQDRDIFFGRAEEIDQLYTLVFQTKLLLVYGQSGTGKTSLIQCGLANRFKQTDWFELFVRRKDNINASLDREIRRHAHPPIAEGAAVSEAIQSLYLEHLRPVYLIFDQFEELFILGSKEEQQTFIRRIAALLKSDVACKIIFVMREEYIATLHDFEKEVSSLFNKRFRVEPMSRTNVQRVVSGTTSAFGIVLEKGDATAEQIIGNLSDHHVGVQLSYLQVYLDKLYREATKPQPGHVEGEMPVVFTEQLVKKTGNLGDVMSDFLDEQTMSIENELRGRYPQTPSNTVQLILEQFATLEGTKHPMTKTEISSTLAMPDAVDACLGMLESRRILHNAEGVYELAHDTLAGRIAERRSLESKNLLKVQKLIRDRYSAFEQARTYLSKEELAFSNPHLAKLNLSEQEHLFFKKSESLAKRKQQRIVAGTLAIMAVLASLAFWANVERLDANDQRLDVQKSNDIIGRLLILVYGGEKDSVELLNLVYGGEKDSLGQIIKMLEKEQKAPLASLIIPKAKKTKVPGKKDRGKQIYDYLIWIDLPSFRRKEISEVKYSSTDLDIALDKEKLGEEPNLGFATSYRGLEGFLPRIDMTIILKNGGTPIEREFNIREILSKTDGVMPKDTTIYTETVPTKETKKQPTTSPGEQPEMVEPKIINDRYDEFADDSGSVTVRFFLDKYGKIKGVPTIVKFDKPSLVKRPREELGKYEFIPAKRGDKNVESGPQKSVFKFRKK